MLNLFAETYQATLQRNYKCQQPKNKIGQSRKIALSILNSILIITELSVCECCC